MSEKFVEVIGLADTLNFLGELPAKIEANILRSALRAGAVIIAAEAKLNVPEGAPGTQNSKIYGGYLGALRDSIRVTTRSKGDAVTARVLAGGKGPNGVPVFYAHMVEYTGAVSHSISVKKPGGSLYFDGGFHGHQVMHPGFRAEPFLRPAADAKANEAVVAVAQRISEKLTPEGLNTPDIEVGDEE